MISVLFPVGFNRRINFEHTWFTHCTSRRRYTKKKKKNKEQKTQAAKVTLTITMAKFPQTRNNKDNEDRGNQLERLSQQKFYDIIFIETTSAAAWPLAAEAVKNTNCHKTHNSTIIDERISAANSAIYRFRMMECIVRMLGRNIFGNDFQILITS